jgi:putative transposase
MRCDNGPELACAAMSDWASGQVGLHFIPLGEPWRNGYVESFNSRIRDECLNINSFWSLTQARFVITDWKHDYNHHHCRLSAPGYQPPSPLRCHLSPPLNDSHPLWISARGPVIRTCDANTADAAVRRSSVTRP